MDSRNDALFDSFLDHPAFRDFSDANLTLANFERHSTGVKCPVGYKQEQEGKNKRLRDQIQQFYASEEFIKHATFQLNRH